MHEDAAQSAAKKQIGFGEVMSPHGGTHESGNLIASYVAERLDGAIG